MSERIVVDPITRIEGHLRIEVQTEGGIITEAYSSGTMVRGIETILNGRDPRDAWAFAQRICGVCTLVHGLASVRAVEDALDYQIPNNARLIRNLMSSAQWVHDHVMHFYHLHALDWVDVVSALKADPKACTTIAQSISSYPKSSPGYFKDVQEKIKRLVESGQLGLFSKGYWGHPDYKLPPEVNLIAVAHYLDALEWQRDVVKLHAIFGGKNPHPNFLVGGVPCAIDLNSDSAINAKRLMEVQRVIERMQAFVEQAYLPDLLAIAGYYKHWAKKGEGTGNFMTYGDFPETPAGMKGELMIPGAAILNRDISTLHEIDVYDPEQIQEFVSHSWYDYGDGKDKGLHPHQGETKMNYTGPQPPYKQLDVARDYSWVKSPRWRGHAMEVGPLARMLILYSKGHDQAKELVDSTLKKLELPVEGLFSTLGRTAARGLESKLMVDQMQRWFNELTANIKQGDIRTFNEVSWEPSSWPSHAEGVGILEAPRGGLAHYIVIDNKKISNYQAVVPSTWNAGPRDAEDKPGPYEAALQDNHELHDPKQPLEILRTIHSFDPCLACAVHITDPDGEELLQINVE